MYKLKGIKMKIKRLWVSKNGCLNDFEIEFDTSDLGTSTILIGENGTGKTTLIETVLEIVCSFDSLGSKIEPKYDYDFEYEYRQCNIVIIKRNQAYQIIVEGALLFEGNLTDIKKYMENKNVAIFPQRVMALYSGRNDKIRQFCDSSIKFALYACNYLNYLLDGDEHNIDIFKRSNQTVLKSRYNYFSDDIIPVLLITLLGGKKTKASTYVANLCKIKELLSIKVNVKIKFLKDFLKNRNDVKLLDAFYMLVDVLGNEFTNLMKESFERQVADVAYFNIKNLQSLNCDAIAIFNFFALLQKCFHAEIKVWISCANVSVSHEQISEGEKQLIKILGMMGICKDEDCLVLIDEPASHMNPKWKCKISNIIDDLLADASFTHALIATHEPLVINGVEKEKIRIFLKEETFDDVALNYVTKAIKPQEDIVGWGIDGILQSEYFGLESVLDEKTRKKMKQKYVLLVKKSKGTLTDTESETLKVITNELENMIFARNIPTDIYYDDYVAALHQIYNERTNIQLSPEDIINRNMKAEEILRGLLEI